MERIASEKKAPVFFLLKCLLCAYILTTVFLLLLAFLLYKPGLTEKTVSLAIIAVYVAATFCGGFLMGKKMENRKFLWGLLIGTAYFGVLFLISLAVNHSVGAFTDSVFTTFMLCAGGGMLGGMLS